MTPEVLRRRLGYRVWARERVPAAVEELPPGPFTVPVVSSLPSLRDPAGTVG